MTQLGFEEWLGSFQKGLTSDPVDHVGKSPLSVVSEVIMSSRLPPVCQNPDGLQRETEEEVSLFPFGTSISFSSVSVLQIL